jgi:hypothetical protein
VCWLIAAQHQCVPVLPSALAGDAYERKLASSMVRRAFLEQQDRARSGEDADTVKPLLDTVICSLERPVDTVIALQDLPIPPSDPSREPLTPGIAASEPCAGLSNTTVDLSVSSRFPVRARPVLPLSGTRLLTIEWNDGVAVIVASLTVLCRATSQLLYFTIRSATPRSLQLRPEASALSSKLQLDLARAAAHGAGHDLHG